MTNGRYIDIENDALRNRLRDVKAAAADLVDAVEKYTAPHKGEFLHRSDLLQVKDRLKRLLR